MSLFIAVKFKNCVCVATDARIWGEIPVVGRRKYDCSKKLATIDEKGALWATSSGMSEPAEEIFHQISNRNISKIESIENMGSGFFKRIHEDFLEKYNSSYEGSDDLVNGINLLFIGKSKADEVKICKIDSACAYKKTIFNKPGDFVFNHIDRGDIDSYIEERAEGMFDNLDENSISTIIDRFKEIFNYVTRNDVGVSPMMFFAKISVDDSEYYEFHQFKRFFHQIKFSFEKYLFFKVLKLHKLSSNCRKDLKDNKNK